MKRKYLIIGDDKLHEERVEVGLIEPVNLFAL